MSGCPRLTPTQVDTAATLLRLTRAQGYPPTERELCTAFGLPMHQNAVHDRLAQCGRAGLVVFGADEAKRATIALVCRCGSGAAFLPVGRKVQSHQPAVTSRDGVCPLCSGVVLLPPRAA